MRAPLVLTGGPAVGKSTTARALARRLDRAAVVEVDDVRQLVVSGAAAPWQGPEGLAQHRLGVENSCALAGRFRAAGFEVIVTDVLTEGTLALYRRLLPGCLAVRLVATTAEIRRRASTRPAHLTEAEFTALHLAERAAILLVDHRLDVTGLALEDQATAVARLWTSWSPAPGTRGRP